MNETNTAEAYYESLYRFALSLARRPYDAEDLVHQTFLKWMKHKDQIRNTDRVKSWLFTTLHREFLRGRKQQARQTLVETDQLEQIAPRQATEPGAQLDAELAMDLVRRVPEPYRAALSLFYIQDFSYREIAEVLEVAPGTVMSRIYRGKQLLKEMVAAWKHGQVNEANVK